MRVPLQRWQRLRAKLALSKKTRARDDARGGLIFFAVDKFLTVANPGVDEDRSLFEEFDLVPQAPRAACLAGAV